MTRQLADSENRIHWNGYRRPENGEACPAFRAAGRLFYLLFASNATSLDYTLSMS
jgi:hypothetical protein